MTRRRRPAGPRELAPLLRDRLTTAWCGSGWARTLLLRRSAAGLLVALAAVLAVSPYAGADPRTEVVVAVRDLAPGVVLDATAVTLRALPKDAVPDGAKRTVDGVTGRLLAAPLRRGEPITDVRLAGAELARSATGAPGAVGVPLRLSDPDVAALLHPGATVDVVTLGERQQQPLVLASGATVLAVLDTATSVADEGGLVLVALPRRAATRVAGASLSQPVTVTSGWGGGHRRPGNERGHMFRGFRDFILRGNIVDLAVAVVIGTAFNALVRQFTESFITPLVAVFTGGGGTGGQFTINGEAFTYGAFVGAVVTFVITAAVVYYVVVVPMNTLMARFKKPAEEELAEPTEAELLTEIRDLLRTQRG